MRWVVQATMTETYDLRVVVDAETAEEAKAKAVVDGGPLDSEEGERTDCWTEVDSVCRLPDDHPAMPTRSGSGPTLCRDCGRPVRWTGTATIPGPWVHE